MYNLMLNTYKNAFNSPNRHNYQFLSKKMGLACFYVILFILPLFANQPIFHTTVRHSTSNEPSKPTNVPDPVQPSTSNINYRQAIFNEVDANKNLAPFSLANPKALWVPREPTFKVWMGILR